MLKRLCAVIRCVALIAHTYAKIEAMKTENTQRLTCGESQAYPASHFWDEAQYLEVIADELKKAM